MPDVRYHWSIAIRGCTIKLLFGDKRWISAADFFSFLKRSLLAEDPALPCPCSLWPPPVLAPRGKVRSPSRCSGSQAHTSSRANGMTWLHCKSALRQHSFGADWAWATLTVGAEGVKVERQHERADEWGMLATRNALNHAPQFSMFGLIWIGLVSLVKTRQWDVLVFDVRNDWIRWCRKLDFIARLICLMGAAVKALGEIIGAEKKRIRWEEALKERGELSDAID
ncbi:hypothetical protein DL98DRAFT_584764 [Cadophora sp. DSE1049]|nr:hypothetical protein DL98DRAFT_584764 [Cadophora sp. DSE1049]